MARRLDEVIKILYETMPLVRFNVVLQAAIKIHELYDPPEITPESDSEKRDRVYKENLSEPYH
jgi:hypothetical protein